MTSTLRNLAIFIGLFSFLTAMFLVRFPYRPEVEYFFLPSDIKQIVVPTWACGDSACAAINVVGYQIPISLADQQQGVTKRWCLSYTRIRRHKGRLAPYFLWAYQTARPVTQVIQMQHAQLTIYQESDLEPADATYQNYCLKEEQGG